ncbi:MAG: signal recognition particle protein [Hydrogenophilus sp.]|nr:signal recognition particle protein [Hydrogenophilus sp.]
MLEHLTARLSGVIKRIRGEARLTEANVQEALREVRLALLEADVALPVVKAFLERVKEKALGQEVIGSLTPGQAFVGVVHEELRALMGGEAGELRVEVRPPAVVLLAGLQGAGKTTTAGKLAKWLREQKRRRVLTVSTDVYRPAAIEQLAQVTAAAEADWFPSRADETPLTIAEKALAEAKRRLYDVLIVDTAGRLAVDEEMMAEIQALHTVLQPHETLFVLDAMLGQDAVQSARAFAEALPLTGVILTKLDGDARGGAALSVRFVTGAPIKFVGVGEKLGGLEPFSPERMAGRILGMGDIVGLVEAARREVDAEKAKALARKIEAGKGFDLNDFRDQIVQLRKMGGMNALLDKLPASMAQWVGQIPAGADDRMIRRLQGIIDSMTPEERAHPEIIKARRKQRIAAGAGVTVQEVNRLLRQFDETQRLMRQLGKGGLNRLLRGMGGRWGRFPGRG